MEAIYQHEFILPSLGKYNPEIPGGKIVQRCMMLKDQLSLRGSNAPATEKLNQLIQKTTISPEGFDVYKLTIPDLIFMIFKLRIISRGSSYNVSTKCPLCSNSIVADIDLSNLNVAYVDSEDAEDKYVTLPHRGDKVYLRRTTVRDLDDIQKTIKKRKSPAMDEGSLKYLFDIVYSIDRIELDKPNADGKRTLKNLIDIEIYVMELTDLDASTILDGVNDTKIYGVSDELAYECPNCRGEIMIPITYAAEFFRR